MNRTPRTAHPFVSLLRVSIACLSPSLVGCVITPHDDVDGGTAEETDAAYIATSTATASSTALIGADPDGGSWTALREDLGEALFEDTRLSEPPGMSCASCHVAQHAFTGNNESSIGAVALGSRPSVFGMRNTPTAMYSAMSPGFAFVADPDSKPGEPPELMAQGGQFWDGRASSLEQQAQGPLLNAREMNNPTAASVVQKVKTAPYLDLFRRVYGDDALESVDDAYVRIAEAIAAFERSDRFQPFTSKFDDVLRDRSQFTAEEQRGFDLFQDPDKGNCIGCHVGNPDSKDPADWPFTDFTYDNLGLPRNSAIPDNADPTFYDLGLCQQPGLRALLPPSVPLESLCGAFKVPTLRNVALTAPYGHNGYFTNLRDVVRFYVSRDTNPERWYPTLADGGVDKYNDLPPQYRSNVNEEEVPYDRKVGQLPRLTEAEIDDLVAFLQTLTDRP